MGNNRFPGEGPPSKEAVLPWKEKNTVTLREEFVLRALEPGANMTETCLEYGISRKTGYKWVSRFKERGRLGLEDLSRRPHLSPLRASGEAVLAVVELRQEHPRWGPRKLRVVLLRAKSADEVPSIRTIARIIDRAGLVKRRRKRTRAHNGVVAAAPNPSVSACNDLWTVDFKGWWRTQDGRRAEPLTVRDAFSRFVLTAAILDSCKTTDVRPHFELLFNRHGLPSAIQVDNGPPFASTRARAGLTRLSAWWVSLGIEVIRGRPGHPQDNGGHERMHLDMRYEVEDYGATNLRLQRGALESWRHEFNHVRPHEALEMKTPADVYQRSQRLYRGTIRPQYPPDLIVRKVFTGGGIRYRGRKYFLCSAIEGYHVGIRDRGDGDTTVFFYNVDIGPLETAQCGQQ